MVSVARMSAESRASAEQTVTPLPALSSALSCLLDISSPQELCWHWMPEIPDSTLHHTSKSLQQPTSCAKTGPAKTQFQLQLQLQFQLQTLLPPQIPFSFPFPDHRQQCPSYSSGRCLFVSCTLLCSFALSSRVQTRKTARHILILDPPRAAAGEQHDYAWLCMPMPPRRASTRRCCSPSPLPHIPSLVIPCLTVLACNVPPSLADLMPTSNSSGLAWHTEENTLRQKFEEFGPVEEAVC